MKCRIENCNQEVSTSLYVDDYYCDDHLFREDNNA